MVHIRPAREGLKVRVPETGLMLDPSGRSVDLSPGAPFAPYWARLLRDGDVVEVPAPPDEVAATTN